MAQVVCCPCGNPVDCDQLELVVTVSCPHCQRELTIELEDAGGRSTRAILTVMEGPFWIGEQFILPVGVELTIGRASGNWLSLDSETLSPRHCRLHLSPDGMVTVEDGKSEAGTWIGKQRIARGKLLPKQSFRAGEFRFRLDVNSSDGTTVVGAPGAAVPLDESGFLPVMREVKNRRDPLRWFAINRFIIARWYMLVLAILTAAYHFMRFSRSTESSRPLLMGTLGAAAILALFLIAGRRVALAHRHLKYLSLAVLVLLAIVDLSIGLTIPAISCLAMAACLTVLILRVPSGALALIGTIAGLCSVTVILTGTYKLVGLMLRSAS